MAEEDKVIDEALGKTITTKDTIVAGVSSVVGGLVGGILTWLGAVLGLGVLAGSMFLVKKKSTKLMLMTLGGSMLGSGIACALAGASTKAERAGQSSILTTLFDPTKSLTEKFTTLSGKSFLPTSWTGAVPTALPTPTITMPTISESEGFTF
jgi:predicted phage tail protein